MIVFWELSVEVGVGLVTEFVSFRDLVFYCCEPQFSPAGPLPNPNPVEHCRQLRFVAARS
jgi:hypothetical protein